MASDGRESGWGSRVVVVLLSLGLLLTVPQWVLTHPIREDRDEMRASLAQIQSEVAALERENQRLREELDLLSRDPRMQEVRIRDELQFIRPDELLLVFDGAPDPDALGLGEVEADEDETEEVGSVDEGAEDVDEDGWERGEEDEAAP